MGIAAPRSIPDRFNHWREDTVPWFDGSETLEPSNLFLNWDFTRLDGKNQPLGLEVGMPEEIEGYYIYLSEKNKGPETFAAQNTEPIDAEEPYWIASEPWVGGHSPTTSLFAAPIAPPEKPAVTKIGAAATGFQAGTYWVSYAWVKTLGIQTALAPAVQVTVGQGQGIRVPVPGPDDDAIGIAFYVSAPNGALSTLRLQEILILKVTVVSTWLLKGPYKSGRPAQTQETRPAPAQPILTKVRGDSVSVPATYSARVVEVDAEGREVASSAQSEELIITEQDAAAKLHVAVSWTETSGNPDTRYVVYITQDEEEFVYTGGNAHASPSPTPATTIPGVGPASSLGGLAGGVGSPGSGTGNSLGSLQGLLLALGPLASLGGAGGRSRKNVSTSGRSASTATTGDTGVLQKQPAAKKKRRKKRGGGGGEGGQSGQDLLDLIAPPTEGLDGVVAEGNVLLSSPGSYWVAISAYARGRETVLSAATKVTLLSNETIKVRFPTSVNLIPNQQFDTVDSSGTPFDWTFAGILGLLSSQGIFSIIDSILTLDTLGARTGSELSPQAQTEFPVDRSSLYAFGGTVGTNMVAGAFEMVLQELDAAGSVLATNIIKSVTSSGETDFFQNFGTSTPDVTATPFNDATASVRPLLRFTGATRNGVAQLKEIFFLDHPRRLRRRESPLRGFRRPSNADARAFIRWLNRATFGTEPPPRWRRVPPIPLSLGKADFGTASPTFPLGWTLRQSSVSGTNAAISTGAAIDGAYGYNIAKTTTNSRKTYLWASFLPTTRTTLGVRAKFRVKVLPDRGSVSLIYIKHAQADDDTNGLAALVINNLGEVYVRSRQSSTSFPTRLLASGVQVNDILDLELIVSGAFSSAGYCYAAVGKNGLTRSFLNTGVNSPTSNQTTAPAGSAIGPFNWTGLRATTAQIGATYNSDPAAQYSFDMDSFVVTQGGDTLADSGVSIPGDPLPLPDRPPAAATYIQSVNFDDGTIPSPWTQTRTPADSTTVLTVQSASAIDGAQGLRVSDTGTAATANVYVERSLAAPANSAGIKARFRVVARPNTGSVRIMEVLDQSGNAIAWFYMEADGDIFVKAAQSSGTPPADGLVLAGVANGTVVTLELVVNGAGGASGMISAWASSGGTGAISERQLYEQLTPVAWSGQSANTVRAGLFDASAVGVTATLDIDSIAVTVDGEQTYREFTEEGREILQVNAHYPKGQPQRDDLFLRGLRLPVKPGETYTAAIYARHAGVIEEAHPYYFYAVDLAGKQYPFGSLYGDDGCIGTEGWADRTRTFTIPSSLVAGETDCYELRMDSYDIGEGEFCCQELAVSRGTVAVREVRYPATGITRALLNADMPNRRPSKDYPDNIWLDLNCLFVTPAGTSASAVFGSSDSQGAPDITPEAPSGWYADRLDVPQKTYAHSEATLATTDERKTPIMLPGNPYLEYAGMWQGMVYPTLLREDGSELPGGVAVGKIVYSRPRAEYDIRETKGRISTHRRYAAIGRLEAFELYAETAEAVMELERYGLEVPWFIESRNRRMKVRFREPILFDTAEVAAQPTGEVWYSGTAASVGEGTEVLEDQPITNLLQPGSLVGG